MKTENPYLDQLRKKYPDFLKSLVRGYSIFPIKLRGGTRKPNTTKELHESVAIFLEFEKKSDRPGWEIEWKDWRSKLGNQRWPSGITLQTADDYLYILQLQKEVLRFESVLSDLLAWRPTIKNWIEQKPAYVFDLDWKQICAVIDYILNNNLQSYYLRSIPVPVHTKFIERNATVILSLLRYFDNVRFPDEGTSLVKALGVKPKPVLYPVRWLDIELARRYTSGIVNLALSSEDLFNLDLNVSEVWFVENDTNLYLLKQRTNAIGIASRGLALNVLSSIPLFYKARLLYWGDLDEAGFRMLQQFRQLYPSIESILMDKETVLHHQNEIQSMPGKSSNPSFHLEQQEMEGWNILRPMNGRIEQEKLDQSFVQSYLFRKGLGSDF